MEPRHLIRAAIAVSVVGHLALVVGVYFADARPFDPATAENIAVDIVTPEQVAEATREAEKPEPEKPPEKQPDPFRLPELTDKQSLSEAKPQGAAQKPAASSPPPQPAQQQPQQPAVHQPSAQQQASQPQTAQQQAAQQQAAQQQAAQQQAAQQQAAQQPPPDAQQQPPLQQQASLQPSPDAASASPPPAQPEPDITVKYGVMLGLPDGNGGGPAIAKADIAQLDIAAFRQHLKSCSKLPPAISRNDKVRVVLRAFLGPDGRLKAEPMLIEAPASAKGPLLMQAAMKALESCQPYAMLPADKYNEWKVLDLPFTPQDFAG